METLMMVGFLAVCGIGIILAFAFFVWMLAAHVEISIAIGLFILFAVLFPSTAIFVVVALTALAVVGAIIYGCSRIPSMVRKIPSMIREMRDSFRTTEPLKASDLLIHDKDI